MKESRINLTLEMLNELLEESQKYDEIELEYNNGVVFETQFGKPEQTAIKNAIRALNSILL